MDSHKLILKLFAENPSALPHAAFVPAFHSFIQTQALPDHLLIDVADYQHVHNGPGTLLVAHEANIYLDNGEGRPGLLYQRKQPFAGAETLRERLAQLFTATLRVAVRLEEAPELAGKLKFRTDEIVLKVGDRLVAPNTPQTFGAVEPALRTFVAELLQGTDVTLGPRYDAQTLFEVRIKTARPAPAAGLLARAETLAAPMLSR